MTQSLPPATRTQIHLSHTLADWWASSLQGGYSPWWRSSWCLAPRAVLLLQAQGNQSQDCTYSCTGESCRQLLSSLSAEAFLFCIKYLKIQQAWQKVLKRAQLLILIGRTHKNRKTWIAIIPTNLNVYHLTIPKEVGNVHFNFLSQKKKFNSHSTAKTCILTLHFRPKGGSHYLLSWFWKKELNCDMPFKERISKFIFARESLTYQAAV